MTAQILRAYQNECLDSILLDWMGGIERTLAVLATGGGKTTIIAELCRRLMIKEVEKRRILVIAHSEEITDQLHERIKNQFAELKDWYVIDGKFKPGIGFVKNIYDASEARIVIAMRQSLTKKRLAKLLSHGAFDWIIVDEAHHIAPENSYMTIYNANYALNPNCKCVGVTATPHRTDGIALGSFFQHVCFNWGIPDGQAAGVLRKATRYVVKTGVNLSGLPDVAGDYDPSKLVPVLDASNWTKLALEAFDQHLKGLPTLAFFPGVGMSKKFVEAGKERGYRIEHIDGTTPRNTRNDLTERFKAGEIDILSNYGCFTEGFDAPLTRGILDARSSKSATVRLQMWGRALRVPQGGNPEERAIILCLCVEDHRISDEVSLLGKMRTCLACGAEFYYGYSACPECQEPINVPDEEDEEESDGILVPIPVIQAPKRHMEGIVATEVPLIEQFDAAWYQDDYVIRSCTLGLDDGALILLPPSYRDVTRLKERVSTGMRIAQNLEGDDQAQAVQRLQALKLQMTICEQFTLWYVSISKKVEYLKSSNDLTAILMLAQTEIKLRCPEAKKWVSRSAMWRERMAQPGQRNLLGGMKNLTGDRIKVEMGITQGTASQLITHYKYVPHVLKFVNESKVPDPQEVEAA